MKRYTRNSSSIGTATHIELKFPRSHNESTKKSRYKCVYYDFAPKECSKTRTLCVGPSNKLCKYYSEKEKHFSFSEGTLVYDKKLGVGCIINNTYPYKIKYVKSNIVKLYSLKEIQKLKKNFTNYR